MATLHLLTAFWACEYMWGQTHYTWTLNWCVQLALFNSNDRIYSVPCGSNGEEPFAAGKRKSKWVKNKSNGFISAEVLIWCVVTIAHESDGLQSSSSQQGQISAGSTREQLQRNRICLLFPSVWTSRQCHSWKLPFRSLRDPPRGGGAFTRSRPNVYHRSFSSKRWAAHHQSGKRNCPSENYIFLFVLFLTNESSRKLGLGKHITSVHFRPRSQCPVVWLTGLKEAAGIGAASG